MGRERHVKPSSEFFNFLFFRDRKLNEIIKKREKLEIKENADFKKKWEV
jgi:hypothetical protein